MAATPALPTAPPKPTWDPRKPEPPFPWLRPTIRIRLTLLYGGMFLIAGILLLSIIYLLAAQALHEGNSQNFQVTGSNIAISSSTCPQLNSANYDEVNSVWKACTAAQRQHA